jgi:hypothetical protein
MRVTMKKPNPHCPVLGCRTDKAHDTDPLVQGMLAEFGSPENLTLSEAKVPDQMTRARHNPEERQ